MQKTQGRIETAARPLDGIPVVVREHGVIAVILLLGFLMRLFLADANSYWLDELSSVLLYGIDNQSGAAVVKRLAEDIHPPLYQLILYYWMALFGNTEVATRTLSNLYVAGATLCLYILTLRLYGRSVAIATALFFSLMYIPIYYALETRAYAQMLFLVSLSSLTLYNFLRGLPETLRWNTLLRDWRLLALVAVNFALLMTHYYDVFFLGAQAIFLLAYLLLRDRGRELGSTAIKAVAIGAAPIVLTLAAWGPVMVNSYTNLKGDSTFIVDTPTKDPFSIFFDMVAHPNLSHPALALAVMGLLLLPRLLSAGRSIYRGEMLLPAYFDFYFLVAGLMPCLLAYLLFLASGHERYSVRYFAFCTPPLAVLLTLSLEEAVKLLDGLASRLRFLPAHRYQMLALSGVMLAGMLVVLPGGYTAATHHKEDWRGTAEKIVELAASEPDKSFIVYETAYGSESILNYYLARFSKTLRVQGVIQRSEELAGEFKIGSQADEIGRHDYLVVAFTHQKITDFPKALAYLAERYKVRFSALHRKRGFIVYSLR